MAKTNWSKIGRVTVKDYRGNVTEFASLADAVRSVNRYAECGSIERLRYGRLAWGILSCPTWGDSHIFLDELGLIIPVWRVQEAYRLLPNRYLPARRFYGWKRSTGHYYRHPKTTQELREGPTRARRNGLPSSWDDLRIMARENRNWKQFRKTQWKEGR
jgi:hypothetical protein